MMSSGSTKSLYYHVVLCLIVFTGERETTEAALVLERKLADSEETCAEQREEAH